MHSESSCHDLPRSVYEIQLTISGCRRALGNPILCLLDEDAEVVEIPADIHDSARLNRSNAVARDLRRELQATLASDDDVAYASEEGQIKNMRRSPKVGRLRVVAQADSFWAQC